MLITAIFAYHIFSFIIVLFPATLLLLLVMHLMKPIARHRAFDAMLPTIGCGWLCQLHNQFIIYFKFKSTSNLLAGNHE